MSLFRMTGAWRPAMTWFYETVVAGGIMPLYQRFVDEATEPVREGGRVLDLGCGAGQVSRLLARKNPTCTVLGLDLSPEMIRRAERAGPALPNLEFRTGDAMELDLPAEHVDLVVSVASIKHWPDRVRGLRQARRVLRPGGSLCLLEVDRRCTPVQARRFASHWRFVLPGFKGFVALYFKLFVAGQALDPEELDAALGEAGFHERQALADEELPFVLARAVRPL